MIRTFIALFALCTLVLISACGKQNDSDSLPIPNQRPAGETNGYAPVTRVHAGGQFCSGVFVSPRAVLTASHCVKNATTAIVQSQYGQFQSNLVIKNGPGISGDARDLAILILGSPAPVTETYAIAKSISERELVHLVGYGCNQTSGNRGSGIKRAGTNYVYKLSEYVEVITPGNTIGRPILGPQNRAGSCFGDSGGPMLKQKGFTYEIVGIDHAIISEGNDQISAYIDLTRSMNRDFLVRMNSQYQLGMQGL